MNPADNHLAPHPEFWRRNRLWIILLAIPLVALAGVFAFGLATAYSSNSSGAEAVSYSQFIAQVKDHNVSSVTLENNSVNGTFKSPVVSDRTNASLTTFTTTIPNLHANIVTMLLADGVSVNVTNDNSNGGTMLLLQWMPTLLLIAIPYLIVVGCLALYLSGGPRPPARHTLA
jgi:ATP-dependent Zn protease